ncbi:hypothetical protein [[Kitasatospora] papulosa]|uniref:hypothetical protein n=1 Tax=[Kitasatospora] papulosa TaxID=1464011 RepID=UPI0036E2D6BD
MADDVRRAAYLLPGEHTTRAFANVVLDEVDCWPSIGARIGTSDRRTNDGTVPYELYSLESPT